MHEFNTNDQDADLVQEVSDLITRVQDREASLLERERLNLLLSDLKNSHPELLRQWELDQLWLKAFQTLDDSPGYASHPTTNEHARQVFVTAVLDQWTNQTPDALIPAQTEPTLKLADVMPDVQTEVDQAVAGGVLAGGRFLRFQLAVAAMLLLTLSMAVIMLSRDQTPPDPGSEVASLPVDRQPDTNDQQAILSMEEPIIAVKTVSFDEAWHQSQPGQGKSALGSWLAETSPKIKQELKFSSTAFLSQSMSAVSSIPDKFGLNHVVDDLIES